jgi:uncharacterized protein YaaN involved in tellurite resistance
MSDQQSTTTKTGTAVMALPLSLDVEAAKSDASEPRTIDPGLEQRADEFVARLLELSARGDQGGDEAAAAISAMGRDLQQQASQRSQMLKQPIMALGHSADDGGPVAKGLVDLRMQVEGLDPAKFDLEPGWFTRTLGFLPGLGNPIKRYFMRFETAQTTIDAIISSLKKGREQLGRDNVTLAEDQKAMRELTHSLARQVSLAELLDQRLEAKRSRDFATDDAKRTFLEEQLLFPLRQRIMDLQQQLAVNQQGVLATNLIIANNKELMRGVDRSLDVTVNALQVAVTVALALANQKVVLDKVESINKTTSDIIAGTGKRLKQQGADIQRRASSSMLDINALKSAFADITSALDDIARYRREALPQMAANIVEFDKLAAQGEESIKKLERGAAAQPTLQITAE